jgi:type II secretory pathway pseudopilin PulG
MQNIPRQSGFTYMALLFFVATMGVLLAMVGATWSTAQQRLKERELLFVGHQFRTAITSFYEKTPGAIKRYPPTLEAMLRDDRQAATVRHLRRVYLDPMTLQADWGLVRAPDGGIKGVYSKSQEAPIKTKGFSFQDLGFEAAKTYADWRFQYDPEPINLRRSVTP